MKGLLHQWIQESKRAYLTAKSISHYYKMQETIVLHRELLKMRDEFKLKTDLF